MRTVLVLRIFAADTQTTLTKAKLASVPTETYSTSNPYTISTPRDRQLQFEPQTNNRLIGTDGVYTVTLPATTVTNADEEIIRIAAIVKASPDFGGVALTSHHCKPCNCMHPSRHVLVSASNSLPAIPLYSIAIQLQSLRIYCTMSHGTCTMLLKSSLTTGVLRTLQSQLHLT